MARPYYDIPDALYDLPEEGIWMADYDYAPDRPRRYRAPSPGLAAVFSVFVPGLGQVYAGRLLAGALWFLGTAFAYSAILVPGFLVHAVCIWSAYQSARRWDEY
jgi:TM2 domain-containing membrane protein YozV